MNFHYNNKDPQVLFLMNRINDLVSHNESLKKEIKFLKEDLKNLDDDFKYQENMVVILFIISFALMCLYVSYSLKNMK